VGGVISLLWFKRKLPPYACKFIEMCLVLTADHGPAVSGAHNTIVAARAGMRSEMTGQPVFCVVMRRYLSHRDDFTGKSWPETSTITNRDYNRSGKAFSSL
jgi:hypothetical protein